MPVIIASSHTCISIHVLRVEDDVLDGMQAAGFLPFQSTSSVWRTTACRTAAQHAEAISIHVLRVEDDGAQVAARPGDSNFNPRPPCGGRLQDVNPLTGSLEFQSTSSVWRTTTHGPRYTATGHHFNPRPPCGGRRKPTGHQTRRPKFQSTSSVWRTTRRVRCDPE